MKREWLKELGLEKEQIDKIMEQNGVDIEAAKTDVSSIKTELDTVTKERDTLKEQVSKRDNQLETLKKSNDVETLKSQIETLQKENADKAAEYESVIKAVKVDAAVDLALTNAKAKNLKAVRSLLDLTEVEFDKDGNIKGLSKQIEALKKAEDSKFMFDEDTNLNIKGAKVGESGVEGADNAVDTSTMTYSELAAYMAANPDAIID